MNNIMNDLGMNTIYGISGTWLENLILRSNGKLMEITKFSAIIESVQSKREEVL